MSTYNHEDLDQDQIIHIRYRYIEFLAEHLADCCRVFQGDLQEMLVLAIIGQVLMRAVIDEGLNGALVRRDIPGPQGISASRIAEVTGIPRETVRRKLAKLQSKGWVEARGSGWMLSIRDGMATARGSDDGLDALDARSISRVINLANRIGRIKTRT